MLPLDHWMLPKNGLKGAHYRAMGLLMASWARFEMELAKCLALFISVEGKSNADTTSAFIATTGMDAKVKIGLLRSVFRYRFPEAADKFDIC